MNSPLVSVIIPTYERCQLAKRAVRSVLAQTYEPVEIVVVEDGSDSDIEKWLQEQALTQVRYLRHNYNKGLAAARNTGLQNSKGKYVAYLDDDDEWMPDKLLKQIALFDKQEKSCGVFYCGAALVSPDGKIVGKLQPQVRGNIRRAIRENGLATIPSSCVFLNETLKKLGGYDEKLSSHVDHDIWLVLAREGYSAEYVDECLVKAYQHHGCRLTEDADLRVLSTRFFCNKWRGDLITWFGPKDARRYLSRFAGRAIAALGWISVYKGLRRRGAKFFFLALCHDPINPSYYVGLGACIFGSELYDRAIGIWNDYDGRQASK